MQSLLLFLLNRWSKLEKRSIEVQLTSHRAQFAAPVISTNSGLGTSGVQWWTKKMWPVLAGDFYIHDAMLV